MGAVSTRLGGKVYLDANIIIYAVEGFAGLSDQLQALLQAMDDGEIIGVTSELTIAEVLIKPLQDQNLGIQQAYKTFLTPTSALHLAPVSRDVLEAAAQLRAITNLKLPDAIHVATATLNACSSFLTNDNSLRSASPVKVNIVSEVKFI